MAEIEAPPQPASKLATELPISAILTIFSNPWEIDASLGKDGSFWLYIKGRVLLKFHYPEAKNPIEAMRFLEQDLMNVIWISYSDLNPYKSVKKKVLGPEEIDTDKPVLTPKVIEQIMMKLCGPNKF